MLAMDSVVEDALTLIRHSDNQTLIMEEPIIMTSIEEDPNIISGSLVQTRDYYLDSSSSVRRKLTNKFSDFKYSIPNSNSFWNDCSGSFELAYREVVALADDRGLWKELRTLALEKSPSRFSPGGKTTQRSDLSLSRSHSNKRSVRVSISFAGVCSISGKS
ncbi:hypothetical protein MRB53_013669 [Persea americana]|uniref:Uncharacterized protein n=1 Tax=Persea americana TaxID=3435 RepID=A0ACC2K8M8_PERAE|nr:hypothetical protein MRB53_013669 [Persea americana]